MLIFAFEMDEDKVRKMGFKVDSVYNSIDDAYAQLQGKLAFIHDNVRYYTRNLNDGNDYQRLWRVALGLRKQPWFIDNLKKWRFMICDDDTGKASYAEDLILNKRVI